MPSKSELPINYDHLGILLLIKICIKVPLIFRNWQGKYCYLSMPYSLSQSEQQAYLKFKVLKTKQMHPKIDYDRNQGVYIAGLLKPEKCSYTTIVSTLTCFPFILPDPVVPIQHLKLCYQGRCSVRVNAYHLKQFSSVSRVIMRLLFVCLFQGMDYCHHMHNTVLHKQDKCSFYKKKQNVSITLLCLIF